MGTNDWGSGTPVRTERPYTPGDEIVFSVAYRQMLGRLRGRYPAAEIRCLTLCPAVRGSDVPVERTLGADLEDFSREIRAAAAETGCRLVDLRAVAYRTEDGIHPTRSGMVTLADGVVRALQRER